MKNMLRKRSYIMGESLVLDVEQKLSDLQDGNYPEWDRSESGVVYGKDAKIKGAKKNKTYLVIRDCPEMAKSNKWQKEFIDDTKNDLFVKRVAFVDGDDIWFEF